LGSLAIKFLLFAFRFFLTFVAQQELQMRKQASTRVGMKCTFRNEQFTADAVEYFAIR
jgi:hypothetical protein